MTLNGTFCCHGSFWKKKWFTISLRLNFCYRIEVKQNCVIMKAMTRYIHVASASYHIIVSKPCGTYAIFKPKHHHQSVILSAKKITCKTLGYKTMAHTKFSTQTRTWSPPTWKYKFLENFSIFWHETWDISLFTYQTENALSWEFFNQC